ncbi:MAG: hypothetical protein ACT4PT_07000 [Methanobacteriota archaeon]
MPRVALSKDVKELERLIELLASSISLRVLLCLAEERRRGEGWLFLSEIAARIGEKTGTVGAAVARVAPFLEERRDKGRRYFRTKVRDVVLEIDEDWGRGRQERLL